MNKIRKGDQVIVLTGRDKGKRGTVSATALRSRSLESKAEIVADVRTRLWPLIDQGTVLPVIGVVACLWLVLPVSSGRGAEQYEIAGGLLAIGIVLWAVTFVSRRGKPVPSEAIAEADRAEPPA